MPSLEDGQTHITSRYALLLPKLRKTQRKFIFIHGITTFLYYCIRKMVIFCLNDSVICLEQSE